MRIKYSLALKQLLLEAESISKSANQEYISVRHFVLALIKKGWVQSYFSIYLEVDINTLVTALKKIEDDNEARILSRINIGISKKKHLIISHLLRISQDDAADSLEGNGGFEPPMLSISDVFFALTKQKEYKSFFCNAFEKSGVTMRYFDRNLILSEEIEEDLLNKLELFFCANTEGLPLIVHFNNEKPQRLLKERYLEDFLSNEERWHRIFANFIDVAWRYAKKSNTGTLHLGHLILSIITRQESVRNFLKAKNGKESIEGLENKLTALIPPPEQADVENQKMRMSDSVRGTLELVKSYAVLLAQQNTDVGHSEQSGKNTPEKQLRNEIPLLAAVLLNEAHPAVKLLENYGLNLDNTFQMYHSSESGIDDHPFLATFRLKMMDSLVEVEKNLEKIASMSSEAEKPTPSRKGKKSLSPSKEQKPALSYLEKYAINITKKAIKGELDPLVGREREIERICQILVRRKKNNPILIGEAGVGKSALVEGVAMRIADKTVPQVLLHKEIYTLDLNAMVAGTQYRGEFEKRVKSVMEDIKKNKNILLFIDEIHTVVGTGNASGSLDFANILKPDLAKGDFQCIGATTVKEYQQHLEKDSALVRRFQKVVVDTPTKAQTTDILMRLKEKYEAHHHVIYTDKAVEACVNLSERYIFDRYFPDKAIDLMDEAGSKVHLLQSNAKDVFYDPPLGKDEMDRGEVDESVVCEVLSEMMGIPVSKINKDERADLKGLSAKIKQKIIGQDHAVDKICQAMIRNRSGLRNPNKPIGTFFFVGPTGVGKTQLAKEIAVAFFGGEDALVRIDMNEYVDPYAISRLIGSAPGYVGYEEAGQLTEKIRRRPYAVVLLDEIEKAHKGVFNIFLQLLDEGHINDAHGIKIDFKNTVVIMTSNVGSNNLEHSGNRIGFDTAQAQQDTDAHYQSLIKKAMKQHFNPEFLNRLDEVVSFNTFDKEQVSEILEIAFNEIVERVAKLGYQLRMTAAAKAYLVSKGFDKKYGARPLKRVLQTHVEDVLAKAILYEEIMEGDEVHLDLEEDKIGIKALVH